MKNEPAPPPAGPLQAEPSQDATMEDVLMQIARILLPSGYLKHPEKQALRQTCRSLRLTVDQTINELTASADSLGRLSKTAMQPHTLTVKAGYLPAETPDPERLARVRKLVISNGQMTVPLGKALGPCLSHITHLHLSRLTLKPGTELWSVLTSLRELKVDHLDGRLCSRGPVRYGSRLVAKNWFNKRLLPLTRCTAMMSAKRAMSARQAGRRRAHTELRIASYGGQQWFFHGKGCKVEGCVRVQEVTPLKAISLKGPISPRSIATLTQLTKLEVTNCWVPLTALDDLTALRALQSFSWEPYTQITRDFRRRLSAAIITWAGALTQLREFRVSCDIGRAELIALSRLPQLVTLGCGTLKVTRAEPRITFKTLRTLYLMDWGVEPAAAAVIDAPHIQAVDFWRPANMSPSLAYNRPLSLLVDGGEAFDTSMDNLRVAATGLLRACRHLAVVAPPEPYNALTRALRALEHWEPLAGEPALNIEAVALVREALQEVPTCVTSLTLSGICFGNHIISTSTVVSDVALEPLGSLKGLKELWLKNCKVTKTAVQRLLEASQQGSSLTIHVPHDTYREQNLDEAWQEAEVRRGVRAVPLLKLEAPTDPTYLQEGLPGMGYSDDDEGYGWEDEYLYDEGGLSDEDEGEGAPYWQYADPDWLEDRANYLRFY